MPVARFAASGLNLRFEVVERDERQDRLAEFWVFVSIDAPKTLGVCWVRYRHGIYRIRVGNMSV